MKRSIRMAFMILLVLGIAACSPVTPAAQDTSGPIATEDYYPLPPPNK